MKKNHSKFIRFVIFLLISISNTAFSAESLNTFTFQGQLNNADGSPVSSTINMTFQIYDNQNNSLWSESLSVSIIAGGFDLMLGKSESNPIPFTVNQQAMYIGLSVGGDPEMEPRQEIGGVLRAGMALSVTDAAITTSKLADNAVTAVKIANNSVTSDKIDSSSITSAKIASHAVTTDKLSSSGGISLSNGTSGQILLSNGDGSFNWGDTSEGDEANVTTISTNITLSADDSGVILVSGNTTVTLPTASNAQGKKFTIKKTDSNSYAATIIATIDNINNPTLYNQFDHIVVISDGTGWYKIGGNNLAPSSPVSITGDRMVAASSEKTYSVDAVANTTYYAWTVPSGASISSGTGTNSIVITFGSDPSGDLCVVARNNNGDSLEKCTTITKLISNNNGAFATWNNLNFYKIQVTGVMNDTNVYNACVNAGLNVPCTNENDGQHSDNLCVDVGWRDGSSPMNTLSQEICATGPGSCAELEGVYQYMGHKYGEDACGVYSGSWCASGQSDQFALCTD
jgi:hypothetical protein